MARMQFNFEMKNFRAARVPFVVRFIFELMVVGIVLFYVRHENKCY